MTNIEVIQLLVDKEGNISIEDNNGKGLSKPLTDHLDMVWKLKSAMVVCTCAAHISLDDLERIDDAVSKRFMSDDILGDIFRAESRHESLRITVLAARDLAEQELGVV